MQLTLDPQVIPKLAPRPSVVAEGGPKVILHGPGLRWARLAAEIQSDVEALAGVRPGVTAIPGESVELPDASNAIVIGSAADNLLLRHFHDLGVLGGMDAPHDGYRAFSMPCPDDPTQGMLAILGLTPRVVRDGWIKSKTHFLEGSAGWSLPLHLSSTRFHTKTFTSLKERIESGDPRHCFTIQALISTLEKLHITGDRRWGRYFIEAFGPILDGRLTLSFWNLSAVDFWTKDLARDWERVEFLPCFTDAQRLQLVNFLIACARYCFGSLTELKWRVTDEDRQIFNHSTYPALGLIAVSGYLSRRGYSFPETVAWMHLAEKTLERASGPGRSFDEGGDNYSWAVGSHVVSGTLAMGRKEYLASPQLKAYADLAVMSLNNHFEAVPYGDSHGYHRKETPAAAILLAAADGGGHPGFLWAARQHAPKASAVHLPTLRKPAHPPLEHVGLFVAPMDEQIIRWSSQGLFPGYPPPALQPNLAPQHSFDKLTLRAGWNPDDDYLLLKGFGGGLHGHPDAGGISQFQARGRHFLTEGDYIRRAPREHNIVQIIRDGAFEPVPLNAALIYTGTFEGGAMVTIALPGYNGCDWTRTIVWLANDCLLCLDSITALAAGDYDVSCYWRTFGEVTPTESGLRTVQDGEQFAIIELTNSDQEIQAGSPPLGKPNPWPYNHGSAVTTLRQRFRTPLEAGQSVAFVNLLVPFGMFEACPRSIGHEADAIVVSGETTIRVDPNELLLDETPVLTWQEPLVLDLFRPAQKSPAPSPASNPTSKDGAGPALDFESPVSAVFAISGGVLIGTETGQLWKTSTSTELVRELLFETGACINAICAGRLWGEEETSILLTGQDSQIHVLTELGTHRLSVPLAHGTYFPGWGQAICLANLDGEGSLTPIVGTSAMEVCAVNPDGTFRWVFPTAAHAVMDLATADLRGDGRDCVIVSTVYFCVLAIDPEGQRVWADEDYNHFWTAGPVFPFVTAADVDDDGQPEVITAAHDTLVHCIDNRGARKWAVSIGDEPVGLQVAQQGIVAASRSGDIHAFDGHGNRLWHRDVGPKSVALAVNSSSSAIWTADGSNCLKSLDWQGHLTSSVELTHSVAFLLALQGGHLMAAGGSRVTLL